ncbi:hypothetical protein HYW17_01875 [Candidatus Uhrbacteria bacterium]|nr:hypothetical protein [Candidatus Uhrbacteria bacterium]
MFFATTALLVSSCVTYTGVARYEDKVYLTGTTSFLIFSEVWVKRCIEEDVIFQGWKSYWVPGLQCIELTVKTEGIKGRPVATPETVTRAPTPSAVPAPQMEGPLPVREAPKPVPQADPFAVVPVGCAGWAELLCACDAADIARRDAVCARAQTTVQRYSVDADAVKDETCKNIVRGMFAIATCRETP